MGALKLLRDALVADLTTGLGIPVHTALPANLDTLPCAYVCPPLVGEYVRGGQEFGSYEVSLDIVLLIDHADPVASLDALDALIESALTHTVDWSLYGVDAPTPLTVTDSGAEYLSAVLHLSKPTRL